MVKEWVEVVDLTEIGGTADAVLDILQLQQRKRGRTFCAEETVDGVVVEEEDREEEDAEVASKETTITPEQIIARVIQERLKEEQEMDPSR